MPDPSQPTKVFAPEARGYRYFAFMLALAVVTTCTMWLFK